MSLLFENVTCGRCAGSGRYGPTVVYMGRCFKCHGTGAVLTKRGKAAQLFLNDLRKRRYDQLAVGDLVLLEGFSAGSFSQPSRWHKVESITVEGAFYIVTCEDATLHGAASTTTRIGFTGEQKAEQKRAALAYQATLTKAGAPSKRRKETA